MPNFKTSRMAEDIKREMTAILRELKDPRIDKLLTIVRADLSGDMSNCKIYVSSLEGMERTKEISRAYVHSRQFDRAQRRDKQEA